MLAVIALCVFTMIVLFGPEPKAHAAALTDSRPLDYKSEAWFPARIYAGVVYRGGMAAVSNGVVYPAANNAAYKVVGVFSETVDNQTTAALYSATRRAPVRQGIFNFDNAPAGSLRLGVADVGKPCYVVDDQTVGTASNGYVTVAGTLVYVEPDAATVWVDVGKVWAGAVPLLTYQLASNTNGLASGRLFYMTLNSTNFVGVVP